MGRVKQMMMDEVERRTSELIDQGLDPEAAEEQALEEICGPFGDEA